MLDAWRAVGHGNGLQVVVCAQGPYPGLQGAAAPLALQTGAAPSPARRETLSDFSLSKQFRILRTFYAT